MNTFLRVLAALVTPVALGAAFAIPTAAGAPQPPAIQAHFRSQVSSTRRSSGSVLGINLSLDSKYATDRSMSYHFVNLGYLCGSNSWPSTAGRMNEGSPGPQK